MSPPNVEQSWFGPTLLGTESEVTEDTEEFIRLWQGFMTARLTLGLVMMALQTTLFMTGSAHSRLLLAISIAYSIGTTATRLLDKPQALGTSFNRSWLTLVGVDVLAFSALQVLQGGSINYTPLFALPVLLAAVLGSLRLALGTAAGVTVVLLTNTLWVYLGSNVDPAPFFVQAALSGVGYFVIGLLASQLSSRLAKEGQRARRNQVAAQVQRQVNELVIESLPDGVLIVDDKGSVRAANPSARQFLGILPLSAPKAMYLTANASWLPLWDLARTCIGSGISREEEITLRHDGMGPQRILVRPRLVAPQGPSTESLCVLFIQDMRELEARMRTEKLASMGRMSTAVAHEIRNPLAAIAQANALLDEDLVDPKQKRLTTMIGQNAKRLGKIVDDILNAAHIQPRNRSHSTPVVALNDTTYRICEEWAEHHRAKHRLQTHIAQGVVLVRFDTDHLHRILVNLLDNAKRYASDLADAIQVTTQTLGNNAAIMSVWSDGLPMDHSVERHLFEPFFSSESRSSGLGLYICRELCDSHAGTIVYQRSVRVARGKITEGNEFLITLVRADTANTPWQPTLY
jgi:two-component system sensor histidine kinase PilS (NtrC family)